MMMFGTTLYGLTFTAFSQWALDNVLTPLYMMTQQKPSSKKDKKAKQNAVTAPVTAETAPVTTETEKPVANENGTPAKNQNGKKAKGGKK
ncbi:MAG: hypothetical protein L6V82_01260 [Clostridiales bacterium]|nr:MAG: hypothetical protein L6V82_01260 [Clostridiales bacterium]